jgi:integrase
MSHRPALRASLSADLGELSPDPSIEASIRDVLTGYMTSKLPARRFAVVRPFALEVVLATDPPTEASAKARMRDASALASWCLDVGIPLEIEKVFDESTVERYIAQELRAATPAQQRTYASNLRKIARIVAPRLQRPRPVPSPRPSSKRPYSELEVDQLIRLAEAQPTEQWRRRLLALLFLGFGAGLRNGEYQNVAGDRDVVSRGGTTLLTVVTTGRTVPMLEPFGSRLHEIALDCPEAYLLGGDEESDRRNVVGRLIYAVRGGADLPRIQVGRLRATWLSHHIRELGIDALVAAAGVTDTHSIFDLVKYLPPPDLGRLIHYLEGPFP